MRSQANDFLAHWPPDVAPPGGVLVLTGYGLDVRVWRGRLRVSDGVGSDRREALIHRATGQLRRLIVLGHTGSISLEAIRWLADVGAGFVQIDADGRVLAAFGPPGSNRPALRRAQARALDTSVGTDIARRLIAEKVAAQSETLAAAPGSEVTDATLATLREATSRLHVAVSRDEIRQAEALAAAAYWSALSASPATFARRDAEKIPNHRRALGSRTSALTAANRLATNPANAVLNYLYAILEAEATLAAHVVGLDPGLGVLHADQNNRDSLSADLMEPVRPLVDRFAFRMLAARSFAASDFYETRQGVCRITPGLARELAATSNAWARAVGSVAEDVARLLDASSEAPSGTPTPISGRNRSLGRGRRPARMRPASPPVPRSCGICGAPIIGTRRTCSSDCEAEARALGMQTFIAAGVAGIRARRAAGWKPTLSDEGRARIGSSARNNVREARAWQRTHAWPKDLAEFEREILPGLAELSVSALSTGTGLSVAYCRQVKAGAVRPHPMWWEALRAMTN